MNEYFAKQCNPFENGSVLPDLLLLLTENKLSEIDIDANSKKGNGHDGIAINMLKMAKDDLFH